MTNTAVEPITCPIAPTSFQSILSPPFVGWGQSKTHRVAGEADRQRGCKQVIDVTHEIWIAAASRSIIVAIGAMLLVFFAYSGDVGT